MSERITYFVDVVLPLSIPNTYTYRLPYELNDQIATGKRVIVPFGKAKYYTAIVQRIHEEVPQKYQVKYVEAILDDNAIVTPEQFQLWDWISDYYMAYIGDVMNASLPSNFKLASETKICLHPEFDGEIDGLKEKELTIIEALQLQEELTLLDVSEIVGIKTVQPLIKALIEKRAAVVTEEVNSKYAPKYQSFVKISDSISSEDELSEVLNTLESNKKNQKSHMLKRRLFEKTKSLIE